MNRLRSKRWWVVTILVLLGCAVGIGWVVSGRESQVVRFVGFQDVKLGRVAIFQIENHSNREAQYEGGVQLRSASGEQAMMAIWKPKNWAAPGGNAEFSVTLLESDRVNSREPFQVSVEYTIFPSSLWKWAPFQNFHPSAKRKIVWSETITP